MSIDIKQPILLTNIAGMRPLGPLELQIMQVIWRREEAGEKTTTIRQVFDVIENTAAYTTVMTITHRLRGKGCLKQVKSARRTGYYYSTVSRQEVGQEILRWTIREFFDGDPAKSVMADEESGDGRKLAVVAVVVENKKGPP